MPEAQRGRRSRTIQRGPTAPGLTGADDAAREPLFGVRAVLCAVQQQGGLAARQQVSLVNASVVVTR